MLTGIIPLTVKWLITSRQYLGDVEDLGMKEVTFKVLSSFLTTATAFIIL